MKLSDIEKNKQPFAVPQGYFDSLPGQLQNRVGKSPAGKNVVFRPLQVMKYAAAAAVLLTAGFWAGSYLANNEVDGYANAPAFSTEQLFASVPAEDLKEYLLLQGVMADDIWDAGSITDLTAFPLADSMDEFLDMELDMADVELLF